MYHFFNALQIQSYLASIPWRSAVEVSFYAITCYYVLLRVLPYWRTPSFRYWMYVIALYTVSYYTELSAIHALISYSFPYMIFLSLLYHQKSIQRVILSPKQHPAMLENTSYRLSYTRECILNWALKSMNKQQELYIIIEQSNPIFHECIGSVTTINTPLSISIIDILLESGAVCAEKMILLTTSETIYGYNAIWKHHETTSVSHGQWLEDTSLYLAQTDGIALYANPKTRLFTVVARDAVMDQIDSNHLNMVLDQLLQPVNRCSSHTQKGHHNASCTPKKNTNARAH